MPPKVSINRSIMKEASKKNSSSKANRNADSTRSAKTRKTANFSTRQRKYENL